MNTRSIRFRLTVWYNEKIIVHSRATRPCLPDPSARVGAGGEMERASQSICDFGFRSAVRHHRRSRSVRDDTIQRQTWHTTRCRSAIFCTTPIPGRSSATSPRRSSVRPTSLQAVAASSSQKARTTAGWSCKCDLRSNLGLVAQSGARS